MKKVISLFLLVFWFSAGSQNLSSSLTACYALNGNANDPVNNLNGVLSSVTPTVDRFNNSNSAYHFTGAVSSYIQLPNSPLLKPTTAFSCNMWLRFDDITSPHYILFASNGCTNYFEGYAMTLENVSGNYRFVIAKSNNTCSQAGQALLFGNTNISAQTWYNVGLYVGTDSMKIYINGAVDAASVANAGPMIYTAGNVYFGSTLAAWNYPMRASLDNVKFYNRKLSNQEVSLLYSTDPACIPAVLPATLTACYALDGNVNEPINGLTGTLSTVTPTTNRFSAANSAYSFNGTISSYIQLPNSPLLKPANAISFSCWTKANSLSANMILLFTKNTFNTNFSSYSLDIKNTGSGYKFVVMRQNGVSQNFVQGTTALSPGTWYHVAFSIDNSSMKLYVNGSLEATIVSVIQGFNYDPSRFVVLGGTNETAYNDPFNGVIDNARFYDGVLTPAEVSALYTSDPSCFPFAYALNFDGVNDYVDPNILVNSFSNNFTYEVWARPTATHEIDPETNIGSNIAGTSGQGYLLWPTHRGSEGGIGVSVGTNGVSVYEHGSNFIEPLLTWTGTLNGWTHIAVVVNNKQPSLYINGSLVKTGLTSVKTNVWPSLGAAGTFPSQVGGIGGGTYGYYSGDADEFRLWNSVRSQSQIASNMFTEFNCPPPGLIAYYKFNHGLASANNSTVTTALDYSGNNYSAGLNTFSLNGPTSNWIAPGAPLTSTASANSLTTATSSTLLCPGLTATLIVVGASTYTWQPGNLSGNSVTVSPSSTIIYTVTGSNGACTASASITVSVATNPSVSIVAQQTLVCPGYIIGLTGQGAQTYTWQPGNFMGASIIPTITASTLFTVTGTSSLGCIDTETVLISVSNCTLPPLGCNTTFYSQGTATSADRIIITDISSPNTSTVSSIILPYGAFGLAIGPAFNFPAPNPTFWTARGGVLWYHNGTTFVNTGQFTSAWNFAGSKNYLYGLDASGLISRYNGTSTVSLGFMIPPVKDLAADDLDNFYLLSNTHLSAYNSAGTLVCSYIPHSGLSGSNGNYAGGLAIIGHSVITSNGISGNLNIGSMTGANLNFTPAVYNGGTYDFASCPFLTAFSSTIVASNPSVSCSSPTIILSATTQSSIISPPLSYVWTGPGILSSPNLSNVSVNAPGVYTCSLTSCIGGTSMATFTVGNNSANPILTASVSPASICSGNVATLTANGASTYTWMPGNLSGNTVTVSPSFTTIYSVMGSNGFCTSFATVAVQVSPNPTVNLSTSYSVSCPGYPTVLSTNQNSLTSVWQPGNIAGNTATVYANATTIYSVTVTNLAGCSSTSTLLLTVNNCTLPSPACSSDFYSMKNTSRDVYATNSVGTLTYSSILPPGSFGLAIGPAFNFPAPNPTYWAIAGGTYWYHNGNTFINTGHSSGSSSALSPGGSKNFIYSLSPTGAVYRYNGLGNATFLTTVWTSNGFLSDIVGDDLDNFYLFTCCGLSTLGVYDQTGLQVCSYTPVPVVHANTTSFQGGLAILGNTVTICDIYSQVKTGVVLGNAINLSTITVPVGDYDFASCVLSTSFSSSITASNGGIITCSNPSVTLTATSLGSGFDAASTYTWSGPGISSPAFTQTVLVNSAGVYTCFLKSCRGGTSTATYTVSNNPSLPLNILSSVSTVCQGGTSTVTASGASLYSWAPSSSINFTTGAMASVSPTITTTYSVTGLTGACVGHTVITISVVPNSSLTLTASNTLVCKGDTVNLSSSPGFTSILWQPGNHITNSITIYPVSTGAYTATALYGSGSGTCISASTINVLVNPIPTLNISSSTNTICEGSSAVLTAFGAPSYTWKPGLSNGSSISVTPLVSTTYTLEGMSNAGCRSYTTLLLHVEPTPTVFIVPIGITGSRTICAGDGLLISAHGATNYTFSPASVVSTTSFPNAYVASPSVTTVYTLTGETNGCRGSSSFTVTVRPTPNMIISSTASHLCLGQSATLSASGSSLVTWEPGTLNGSSIVVNPTVNTTYTATGLGDFGCQGKSTTTLTVTETPTLTLSASSVSVCIGTTATLQASGATDYTWMPGSQTASSIVIIPGTSVVYTVTGANDICRSSSNITVTIIDCTVPRIFGLTNAAEIPVLHNSKYYKINFTVIAKNASQETLYKVILNTDLKSTFPYPCTYTVITAPRITSFNSNLSHNSLFDGNFEMSLSDPFTSTMLPGSQDTLVYGVLVEPKGFYGPVKNSVVGYATLLNNIVVSDSSNNGFNWDPDKDGDPTNNNDITIIDLRKIELFIPEGFSPNGDGKNDLFEIKGLNERRAKISIFNRWGNKVFTDEGTQISWDGKTNASGLNLGSDKLPPATYFYVLEFLDGDKQSITGFVVLQY